MELVFEAKGPILLDKATGKKTFPLFPVQFILSAEGPVFPHLGPETKTFYQFPCPIFILAEKHILKVKMMMYHPDATLPIYAIADDELWEIKKRRHP